MGRIFEPFFTTKGVGMGSGLGLAICKNLVSELGGEIRIESQTGSGTRFVVQLPVQAEVPAELRPDDMDAAPRASVRGRLLVIDDEEPIRKTLVRLLGRDHEIVTAGSGREGQAILESDSNFDLVFCDLMMPQMTGMDLHAWLAERNPALAGQIVFITGGAFTPRANEYLATAGNLKVEKPFAGANLRKLVSELVIAARSKGGTPG
jgi:CheY-like chemotaxis protein